MFRQLAKPFLITLLTLGLAISCSHKKKATDETADGNAATEAGDKSGDVTSADMNFNPTGSDSGTIQGLNTIHFPYDQSVLDNDNKTKLNANAEWLKSHGNVVMQIEGHCDNRGSVEYNLALGERRAKAVKAYLTSMGVKGSKLRVVSYGKEKPIAQGDSEDAYSKNRRANFVPLPK